MPCVILGSLHIYFGDASHCIAPDQLPLLPTYGNLLHHKPFMDIADTLPLSSLFFAHQTHSSKGIHVTPELIKTLPSFSTEADFLSTNTHDIGLGNITADCVPFILYDHNHQAYTIVHAGWRGSVDGVARAAVREMQTTYATHPADVQVIFGPSARSCCYEIGPKVIAKINMHPWGAASLTVRNGRTYCDLVTFNALSLQQSGVPHNAMYFQRALCTICSTNFCSYRRDSIRAGRQITVAIMRMH